MLWPVAGYLYCAFDEFSLSFELILKLSSGMSTKKWFDIYECDEVLYNSNKKLKQTKVQS